MEKNYIYCMHCGEKLESSSIFCACCGKKVITGYEEDKIKNDDYVKYALIIVGIILICVFRKVIFLAGIIALIIVLFTHRKKKPKKVNKKPKENNTKSKPINVDDSTDYYTYDEDSIFESLFDAVFDDASIDDNNDDGGDD